MILITVIGPYRGETENDVRRNIERAADYAREIWRIDPDVVCFCPHLNSAWMGGIVPDSQFLAAGVEMVLLSEAVFELPRSQDSVGAQDERRRAERAGTPVFTLLADLREWVTKKKREQAGG